MKKASIILFAIASFVSGCDLLGIPGTDDGFELCLQNGFTPCKPAEPSDLTD